MTDLTKSDFANIYQETIYELNAEILFSVAYTETEKNVYTLNEQINDGKFDKKLNDNTKIEVIEIIKNFFKKNNIFKDKKGNENNISDFNKKLNFFKEEIYDKKKEDIINFINSNNFG